MLAVHLRLVLCASLSSAGYGKILIAFVVPAPSDPDQTGVTQYLHLQYGPVAWATAAPGPGGLAQDSRRLSLFTMQAC